jgi:hypothetical protein
MSEIGVIFVFVKIKIWRQKFVSSVEENKTFQNTIKVLVIKRVQKIPVEHAVWNMLRIIR